MRHAVSRRVQGPWALKQLMGGRLRNDRFCDTGAVLAQAAALEELQGPLDPAAKITDDFRPGGCGTPCVVSVPSPPCLVATRLCAEAFSLTWPMLMAGA